MVINAKKSSCMLICNRQKRTFLQNSSLNLNVCNESLSCVRNMKTLGITIDDALSWRDQVNEVSLIKAVKANSLFKTSQKLSRYEKQVPYLYIKELIMTLLYWSLNVYMVMYPCIFLICLLKDLKLVIHYVTIIPWKYQSQGQVILSFSYAGAIALNSLPEDVRMWQDINSFKYACKVYYKSNDTNRS